MNITAFIAIALLGILTFVGITHKKPNSQKITHSASSTSNPTSNPTSNAVIRGQATPTEEQKNTNEPTDTPFPTLNHSTGSGQALQINDFVYPNSSQANKSDSSINLSSSDDPNSIFSWYQQKINSLHMGAKSIVNTKTNNNVNDVLDAAGNGSEVKITILKNYGDSVATITVTISANNSNSVNNSVNSTNNTTIQNNINSTSDTSNTY